jgi:hypothetical protein
MTDAIALSTRAKLRNYTKTSPDIMYGEFTMSKGAVGALIGHLNKTLGGDDERYLVCGWLFNKSGNYLPMRSGELEDEHWYALYKWVEFWKNEDDDKWYPREGFNEEALAVYSAAVKGLMEDATVEDKELAGVDSMGLKENALTLNGAQLVQVTEASEEEAPTVPSEPVVVPKSLRGTRFASDGLTKDKERKLLESLGYDPDEEGFEGF